MIDQEYEDIRHRVDCGNTVKRKYHHEESLGGFISFFPLVQFGFDRDHDRQQNAYIDALEHFFQTEYCSFLVQHVGKGPVNYFFV